MCAAPKRRYGTTAAPDLIGVQKQHLPTSVYEVAACAGMHRAASRLDAEAGRIGGQHTTGRPALRNKDRCPAVVSCAGAAVGDVAAGRGRGHPLPRLQHPRAAGAAFRCLPLLPLHVAASLPCAPVLAPSVPPAAAPCAIGGVVNERRRCWSLLAIDSAGSDEWSPLLESQEKLPAAKQGGEPLPEGLMWLLLTGEVCGMCDTTTCCRGSLPIGL